MSTGILENPRLPRHISGRGLAHLRNYAYKATGYTILDELHAPAWNYFVECLPMWLAPNLITLAGLLCVGAAYALNIVYIPEFQSEAPRWVYALTALAVFLYVNLDCMDGKQARRTRSSSPLGQLFDHGCDALALHMLLANIAASLGVGCGLRMAAGCAGVMVPWILAQWEEYHTGIMVYGTRYYGVLEANYSICAVHLVSAVLGPSFWRRRLVLPAVIGQLTSGVSGDGSIELADAALVVVALAGVGQAAHNIVRVLGSGTALAGQEAGDKSLGRLAALQHLAALLGLLALGAVPVAAPVSVYGITWSQQAITCRLAVSSWGTFYALTACTLIVAHMAKEPFRAPKVALYTCGGVVTNWLLDGVVDPVILGVLAAVFGAMSCGNYVVAIIAQICEELQLSCFTIKPQKPAAAPQQQQPAEGAATATASTGGKVKDS